MTPRTTESKGTLKFLAANLSIRIWDKVSPMRRPLQGRFVVRGRATTQIRSTARGSELNKQVSEVAHQVQCPVRSTHEEPLGGGNVSAAVVRIGDTVRRPTGPWTPAVHGLLRHLEQVGFLGAPRVLGSDEQDREILEYVPGSVPWGPAHCEHLGADPTTGAVNRWGPPTVYYQVRYSRDT